MRNRKNKTIGMRFLSAVGAFLLIGSVVYIFLAGINLYVGAALTAAVLGLGVPSVSEGESLIEIVVGVFESFVEGVMEVVGGIVDAVSSIFS